MELLRFEPSDVNGPLLSADGAAWGARTGDA